MNLYELRFIQSALDGLSIADLKVVNDEIIAAEKQMSKLDRQAYELWIEISEGDLERGVTRIKKYYQHRLDLLTK